MRNGPRMRTTSLIGIAAGVLVSTSGLRAADHAGKRTRIPPVPQGHPRVYIRPADVPALRRKVQLAEFTDSWKLVRESRHRVCKAFIYLMTGNTALGREAVERQLEYLKAFDGDNTDTNHDGRPFYNRMHMGACVYDWCYDLLSEAEKREFVREFKRFFAEDHHRGYPPKRLDRLNPVVGHDCEGCIMSNLLPAGLAVYDEDPGLYELGARLFFQLYAPVRNDLYRGHAYWQGTSYADTRFMHDQVTSWLFRKIGAGDVLSREQRFVPYHLLYAMRPDGRVLPMGDSKHGPLWRGVERVTAAYYDDPYLLSWSDQLPRVPWTRDRDALFHDLLFLRPNARRASLDELPLTKYFGPPMGEMIARTGWDMGPAGKSAIIHMRIGERWFVNHQHADWGTFQIYYRGPLAIDTGGYQTMKKRGPVQGNHLRKYHSQTIAHNALMIFDPATAGTDYGGQPRKRKWMPPLNRLRSQHYHWGRVTAHAFGPDSARPDYSYIAGDITQAYTTRKASRVTRSMVTFNTFDPSCPAHLVIFDDVVSTDPGFKKAWYLHSIQEPVVEGRKATVVRDGKDNKGNPCNGQLVVQSLLPAAARIDKVGGPGRECWNEALRQNFALEPPLGRRARMEDLGAWRIEVVPTRPAREDLFLHVLSVMDKGARRPAVALLRGDRLVGAQVAGHVVLFNCTDKLLRRTTFEIAGRRTVRVLVCGLAPGTWTVSGPSRAKTIRVTTDTACLYLRGAAGKYELRARPPR